MIVITRWEYSQQKLGFQTLSMFNGSSKVLALAVPLDFVSVRSIKRSRLIHKLTILPLTGYLTVNSTQFHLMSYPATDRVLSPNTILLQPQCWPHFRPPNRRADSAGDLTSSEHPFGTIRACEEKLLNLPLHYVIKFQIPSVQVPIIVPPALAWTDDLIKRLVAEIKEFGAFGHVEVDFVSVPEISNVERTMEARLMWTMTQMLMLKIVIQHSTADDHAFPGDEDMASHAADHVIDTPDRVVAPEFELQPSVPINAMVKNNQKVMLSPQIGIRRRRVRRMAPNLLSPYISQPQTKQSAIRMDLKQAAALVFGEDLDARSSMPTVDCCSMNMNEDETVSIPYIASIGVGLLTVLIKNHWTLYVYDLSNKRIQLLDSCPGRKKTTLSGIQQNLAKVVLWLAAHRKRHDCGVFVMKFMELWSMGVLQINRCGTILRGCMHLIDLADSERGQAKTLMFVHISPEPDAVRETLAQLNLQSGLPPVELGAARVNKDSADVKELKEQIATLNAALARKEGEPEDMQHSFSNRNSPPWPPISSAVQNYVEDDKDIGSENRNLPDAFYQKLISDSSKLFPDQSYNIFMANNRYDIANNDDLHEDAATGASSDVDLLWQFNNAKITSMTNGIVSKIKKPNTKPANSPKLRNLNSTVGPLPSRKL
ncbi:Kinesin-like protein KIN-14I [Vitis vinifera]|uniref:Kinesin-like protein KIN-14I n=1 Tax=Vitis vinifera TaxID=29760 RepID=A0A438CJH0_VITVI|nr:Kinesin-like protein KIN-14I [Vitis vinifera]